MTVDRARLGLTLTGEFRRAFQEEPREGSDGKTYPGRYKVRVLDAGDRTVDVEFKDQDRAVEVMGGMPEPGDVVSIPVGVRAAKGFAFFFGRRERE